MRASLNSFSVGMEVLVRSVGKVDMSCSSTELYTQRITVYLLTVQKAYSINLIILFCEFFKTYAMWMMWSCIDSLFSLFDANYMKKKVE